MVAMPRGSPLFCRGAFPQGPTSMLPIPSWAGSCRANSGKQQHRKRNLDPNTTCRPRRNGKRKFRIHPLHVFSSESFLFDPYAVSRTHHMCLAQHHTTGCPQSGEDKIEPRQKRPHVFLAPPAVETLRLRPFDPRRPHNRAQAVETPFDENAEQNTLGREKWIANGMKAHNETYLEHADPRCFSQSSPRRPTQHMSFCCVHDSLGSPKEVKQGDLAGDKHSSKRVAGKTTPKSAPQSRIPTEMGPMRADFVEKSDLEGPGMARDPQTLRSRETSCTCHHCSWKSEPWAPML